MTPLRENRRLWLLIALLWAGLAFGGIYFYALHTESGSGIQISIQREDDPDATPVPLDEEETAAASPALRDALDDALGDVAGIVSWRGTPLHLEVVVP